MDANLIRKYEGMRVPRYTSYPTAPHFTDAVGPETAEAWYRELDPAEPISIYFHVPFCRVLCWYCGCRTRVVGTYDPIAAYAETLAQEVALVLDRLPAGLKIGHLHWGGGSPTALSPEDFSRLMRRVTDALPPTADAELALEVDPRTLTAPFADAMADCGINRVSLGIQCFDPQVQKAINRVQSIEETGSTLEMLKDRGITARNFDLVYGLPHQTMDSVKGTVDACLDLGCDRISVFGYAHLPKMLKHQRMIEDAALPDGRARAAQFQTIGERLLDAGMVPIGLDHFAWPDDPLAVATRAGTLHRNFQGYTTDACPTLIGFGASALGQTRRGHLQNAVDTATYHRAIQSGSLATAKGLRLDRDEQLRARLIEALMCTLTVDVAEEAIAAGLPLDGLETSLASLAPLEADGLVVVQGTRLTVPEEARPLVRVVAAAFDAYLDPSAGRHAVAV